MNPEALSKSHLVPERMVCARVSYLRHNRANAYVRLLGPAAEGWDNRAHFFKTASGIMRNILVDYARARRARKRDGALQRVELDFEPAATSDSDLDRMLMVDEALVKLATWDERQAKVVELRYFAGFDVVETAEILGVSEKTVKRDWSMARAWLQTQLDERPDEP